MAVERETWILVRGASNRVPARFATLAVIAACNRPQIISCRPPGAERGSDAPSRISSYGLLTPQSKPAFDAEGKRRFFLQNKLANRRTDGYSPRSFETFMSVKIRMKRVGAKNSPYFRIVVADSRSPRDGKFIEEIGSYQPLKQGDNFILKLDRAQYWVSKGAQPSDTVASFIKKAVKSAVPAAA